MNRHPLSLARPALRRLGLLTAGTLTALAGTAQAHAVLETRSAPAGTSYKAVVIVGHGCDGQSTHTVRVQIPAGLRGAKPMPKAGWDLAIRKEALATPYKSHGKDVTEDTVEVTWTARGPEFHLPDGAFDEFILRGQLPSTPGPLWFKIQQRCPSGVLDWSDIPAVGTSTLGIKSPAALLEVLPVAPPDHGGGGHAH